MYDYGYPAHILPGLGRFDAWGKQILWCQPNGDDVVFRGFQEGRTKTFADITAAVKAGNGTSYILKNYPFLDGGVKKCTYASKNFEGTGSGTRKGWNWNGISSPYSNREISPGGSAYMSEVSARVLEAEGYVPYIPFRAVKSPFFRGNWMQMPFDRELGALGFGDASSEIMALTQPGGYFKYITDEYSTTDCSTGLTECCGYRDSSNNFVQTVPFADAGAEYNGATDKMSEVSDIYNKADCNATFNCNGNVVATPCSGFDKTFTSHHQYRTDVDCTKTSDGLETFPTYETVCDKMMDGSSCGNDYCANVASRNAMKETLFHAQCAYFVSIVIVQWADLLICKTRMNSIYHQGMLNPAMNYGLLFETLLAAVMCYTPGLTFALGTRPLKFLHWMPGIPYSIFIFLYDETRKKIMRMNVVMTRDKQTGQVIRNPGWVERNTYY
jgi:sodium/potassium-transporting ATPase subunit alpha